MGSIRRYVDEEALDDLVCPPEPKAPEPEWERKWREKWEADERQREAARAHAKEAREERSRDFSVSKAVARGESPEEEY